MTTSSKLTIGLVCDDSLDRPDGVQQYVLTLGAWLEDQGHTVHYITSGTHTTALRKLHSIGRNVGVRFNGNRLRVPLPVKAKDLDILFEDTDFDVLHVQMPYSPFLAGKVITRAPETTAVIGTFHIFPHSRLVRTGTKVLKQLVRRSLPRFDEVMSVSSPAQAFAKEAFGITTGVVPNMVDVRRFRTANMPFHPIDTVNIVFLGRLVARKGSLQLLKAVHYLHEHKLAHTKFRVVIGGKGPLKEELERYIDAHKLHKLVQLVGFVSEEDKASFLAGADIACFPSTGGESFGISLIEAMAATPGVVLAGDNEGYRSVMDVATDQLFSPTDIPAFARLLASYIDSPVKRGEAHAWQAGHVRQFDTPIVGRRILAVYEQALRSRERKQETGQ